MIAAALRAFEQHGSLEGAIEAHPELEEELRRLDCQGNEFGRIIAATIRPKAEEARRSLAPLREEIAQVRQALARSTACSWRTRRQTARPRARARATRRCMRRARSPARRADPGEPPDVDLGREAA